MIPRSARKVVIGKFDGSGVSGSTGRGRSQALGSKVRFADQPPRTRSAAPAPTRLKASLATPGWDKGFGSGHVRGDYKALARFRGLNPRINGRRELEERSFNSCQFDNVQHRLERDLELIDSG